MSDIRSTFDRAAMQRVCTMPEREFAAAYDMTTTMLPAKEFATGENFYFFRDHGSRVLAVAHLDTVGRADERDCHFIETEGGEVVYSRALDDRLGAYIILDWLPAIGIQYDILLTVGEESGNSTAAGFTPPDGKKYDWIIEFDRGGTDVVMYQFDDKDTQASVRRSGARVGDGIFSDICYLEHLGVKAFNWGVGYRDYHGPRAHAYLEDTYMMLGYFIKFHGLHYGLTMPHAETEDADWWSWDYDGRTIDPDSCNADSDGDEDMWPETENFGSFDDDNMWVADDALDRDWIEYPTLEQLRQHEERADRLSEYDRG